MRLSVSSDEPLEHVLEVVGSLYGVKLSVEGTRDGAAPSSSAQGRAPRRGRPVRSAKKAAPRKAALRKAATKKASPRRSRGEGSVDPAAVRAWARDNGLPVRERGRVPAEIVQAYREGTGR